MKKQRPNKGDSDAVAAMALERDELAAIYRPSMFWTSECAAASAWTEHVPFAFWLVDVLRPSTIVELGTHNGVSYSAMCQAVKSLGLPTRCFAVDTWKGDAHAGFYPEEIYRDFATFHDQRYSAFSRLVRSTFDEALPHFEDGSIDLLHIDGLHTYDAVRHDFESWLPKLSPNAVILFHDTNVRENNFGVFRLWSEIASGRLHFNFLHGHGLGILGLGHNYANALRFFFDANEDNGLVGSVREIFASLGKSAFLLCERSALAQALAERDRELGGLQDALAERNAKVAALGQEVVNLRSQLAGKARELDRLFASISWRLTSPLRKAHVKLSHIARLRTQCVELRPLNQLKREAQAGSVVEWRMMGDDANFEIDLSRTGPLSPGHYRLIIELPKGLTALNSPSLYVDSGNGLRENECLNLNFVERGRTGIASFSIANGVRALRLDPGVQPGIIAIGRVWLRRMSRIEYYSRLIARLVRYRINSPADLARAVKRAITVLAHGGPRRLTAELRSAGSRYVDQRDDYQHWIELYDTMTKADKDAMRRRVQSFAWQPLISVIMPVHNTPEALLRKAIESVREQIYDHWELCIADDCSTAGHVRKVLDYYARLDPRIRVCFRTTNGGIAEASNSALAIAKGEFVALLDHDDEIPTHALALVAEAIAAQSDIDLIFSDEDKLDAQGRRFDPYFKSDWNPALMLSQNMFCHLGVYRRSIVENVGGFRLGFEGSQDHDLVLRCSRETIPERIRHIPNILYHWRAIESSTAADSGVKPYAWDAGRRAIEEHLAQKNIHAKVEHASRADCYYQVDYAVPTPPPRVSILIPTTAKPELIKPCLDSILKRTTYDNFEVLVLVGETQRAMPERAEYLSWASQQPRVRMLAYPDRPFNFSWVNNWGAGQATGDVLCLLNDDTEIITPDWLEKLVARVSLDGVGAVGPMMYFPNDTIQHAGVILGILGVAAHVFKFASRGFLGYFNRACLEQDLSCVTAGCMVVRKEAYLGIGGMDESFAVAFNDVDFCIRLRAADWRIIWTPVVELYHRESVSVGRYNSPERTQQFSTEVDKMRKLWGPVLDSDPYYNVNLSLSEPFSLAFPPRQTAARR